MYQHDERGAGVEAGHCGGVTTRWLRQQPVLRVAHLGTVFALAVALGRATRLDGTQLALVWPASAVGFLWLLVSWPRRRAVVLDAVALLALAAGRNAATGADVPLALMLGTANVVQAVTVCLVFSPVATRARTVHRSMRDFAALFQLAQQFSTTPAPMLMGALPGPISQPEDIAHARGPAGLGRGAARHRGAPVRGPGQPRPMRNRTARVRVDPPARPARARHGHGDRGSAVSETDARPCQP